MSTLRGLKIALTRKANTLGVSINSVTATDTTATVTFAAVVEDAKLNDLKAVATKNGFTLVAVVAA